MVARALLERQGMGPVTLRVTRFDLSGLHLQNLSLYGGAIRASDLELGYSPFDIAAGTLDRAEITGLFVALNATGDAITLGGAPLPFSTPGPAGSTPRALRVDALRLADAHLSLATPSGPLEATFSTDLAIDGGNIQNTGLTLDLSVATLGTVHIIAPDLALKPEAGGGILLHFGNVEIQPKGLPWVATDITGELTWNTDKLAAKLVSGLVASTQSPAAIVPLAITADAQMTGPDIAFAVHAVDPKKIIDVHITGKHDRTSGAGNVTITSRPMTFRTGVLQPRDLFPASGSAAPSLTGTVALSGAVGWRDAKKISPAVILHLTDLAVAAQGAVLSKVHGDITFTGVSPLTTATGQVLHAVIASGSLPPVEATMSFQLLPAPALHVQGIDFTVAGGRILTSAFNIDPVRPDIQTVIAIHQVDLAEIFKLIGISGLSGTGRLDGEFPLATAHGSVIITGGHLAASGSGVLRLSRDALPKQITEAGASMNLALDALADFHYDTLEIDLSAGSDGSGDAALSLKGNNPAVLEGRAFNLNIHLSTNFDRLIDIATRSRAAAEALLRKTAGSIRK